MKIFISLPMKGKTDEQIKNRIGYIKETLTDYYEGCPFPLEFVDNLIEKPEGESHLYCLGEAIKKLGECDYIFLDDYWYNYNGCNIEYQVAKIYDIKRLSWADLGK